jgi:glutathione-specific gamma-glutamylcyclotransferase
VALWVFGYGSLLFRPGFPFVERRAAYVEGWERRLDQGSPDHRGTPERLGRVATLVEAPGRRCGGAVYRIADDEAPAVLAALDVREQGGYDRLELDATILDDPPARLRALTWVATPDNPYHLGPAPLAEMVAQIRAAVGPSGANLDYALSLHAALTSLGIVDPHVAAVAAALAS